MRTTLGLFPCPHYNLFRYAPTPADVSLPAVWLLLEEGQVWFSRGEQSHTLSLNEEDLSDRALTTVIGFDIRRHPEHVWA